MATFDLVLLSSSPPSSSAMRRTDAPPSRAKTATYSPMVLSPLGSPKKTPSGALKSGSRAGPVPDGASRGFATAGSLVKSRHFSLDHDSEFAELQQGQARRATPEGADRTDPPVKKARKPSTKTTNPTEDAPPKPKKPRGRKPKSNKDSEAGDAIPLDPRSEASTNISNEAPDARTTSPAEPALPKAKVKTAKVRKPAVRKEKTANDETRIRAKRPKATKAEESSKSGAKAKTRVTGAVSSHFQNSIAESSTDFSEQIATTSRPVDQDTSIWDVPSSPQCRKPAPKARPPDEHMPLELDEAITRRRDWTPPPENTGRETASTSVGKENVPTQRGTDQFTNMLTTFAYADSHPPTSMTTQPPAMNGIGATKRRRVELVDIPGNQPASRNSSPEKGKAPKKKARTITDLVTEQYTTNDPLPNLEVTSAFFESRTTTKVPLKDAAEPSKEGAPAKKPTRKRSTSKSDKEKNKEKGKKPKKVSGKAATKPKLVAEKLLSPASATLRISKQEVLFGTSSQLALEGSPTMVRQIQTALKQSEQDADMAEEFGRLTSATTNTRPPPWPRLGRIKGKKDLWAASARDDEGKMLQVEKLYLPEPDRTQDIPLLLDGAGDGPDESFADIDDFQLPNPGQSNSATTKVQVATIIISSDGASPLVHAAPQHELLQDKQSGIDTSFDHIDNYESPPPSNQNAESSFLDIDDFPLSADPLPHPPPVPIASTTSTSVGSPVKKKRGRPPKPKSAISASGQSDITTKPNNDAGIVPPSTPTKKSRFAGIEEILDSEDDEALSPTPPRTSHLQNSLPLPLVPSMPPLAPKPKPKSKDKTTTSDADLVHVFQVAASQLLWAGVKDQVFKGITEHIRTLEPTKDPRKPSWHEKILMYDPIVLEDFTAYLNTCTSIRTYKKATVKQVKAWNSCQKKKGMDGLPAIVDEVDGGDEDGEDGATGLKDEKMVNVVAKELETYMAQAWCQEMSVCCISALNKGNGRGRKGLY